MSRQILNEKDVGPENSEVETSRNLPFPLKMNSSKQSTEIHCVTDFELQRIKFVWTIHNFSTIRMMAQDKSINQNVDNRVCSTTSDWDKSHFAEVF
eukprot:GHVP01054730.1.p1 GENE.GHVP01054730.1~~GHVP01054730.1.p1  ORF type:complete len:112 (+),score=10.48 GHVP01054730.1:50-337(+)